MVLGPFVFAACMFSFVAQVRRSEGWGAGVLGIMHEQQDLFWLSRLRSSRRSCITCSCLHSI